MDTTDVTAILSPQGGEVVVEKGSLSYDAIAEWVDPPFRTMIARNGWVMVVTVRGDMGKPSGLIRNSSAERLVEPDEILYGTVLITGLRNQRLRRADLPALREELGLK